MDILTPIERLNRWMTLRGLKPNTVIIYNRIARRFLEQHQQPIHEITRQDVEQYLLAFGERGASPQTRNLALAALRSLFRTTVGRDVLADIPAVKSPRRLPAILSGTEILRLLQATKTTKYRAIFMLAYGAGLRVGEITAHRSRTLIAKECFCTFATARPVPAS